MDQATHTKINNMTALQIIKLLEAYGFAVNESETIGELREAVRVNVEDGTISRSQLAFYADASD